MIYIRFTFKKRMNILIASLHGIAHTNKHEQNGRIFAGNCKVFPYIWSLFGKSLRRLKWCRWAEMFANCRYINHCADYKTDAVLWDPVQISQFLISSGDPFSFIHFLEKMEIPFTANKKNRWFSSKITSNRTGVNSSSSIFFRFCRLPNLYLVASNANANTITPAKWKPKIV